MTSAPRSISKDLTVGLILVVLLVSSIALVTAYYAAKKKAESELQTKADEYVAFLKDTLVTPLWNYDFETISAVCQTYLQNDLITSIQVRDQRGLLDISMSKPVASSSFVRQVELTRHDIPIGNVQIALTHGYLTRFNRQLFWYFALTILINIATLAVLTGLMLRMLLKRPLDRLNTVVNSYASGEYHMLDQDVRHTEFKPLVDTLDQMGSKIQFQLSTIQKAEKKYRSIFENALEGIYQSTYDGRILSANPAYARILGYDSPEQLMAEITDIGSEHWVEAKDRQRMVQSILDSAAVQFFEAQMTRKDGGIIWVLINGRAVYDSEGGLRYIEGMVQDITHRKVAEAEKIRFETQLRQTQKMEAIGTLAGGIAHDFNNMLGVIIGCSELAMDTLPESSVARADMEKVIDAGMRAKSLVRQILTFSRQSESDPKPLMLTPFIKEVVKFLKATLPASIEIKIFIDSENDVVMADPTQLQQVLMNLCTNAAHAMAPEGGIIEIMVSEHIIDRTENGDFTELAPAPYLNITIRDSGCGIEKDDLHRIFDPFFTTKGVGAGTGLGLSVVHGIVKAHDGGVYVHSDPGKGTTFQVLLPSLSHPEIIAVSESPMPLPEGSEKILVVEDEAVLGDIIKRILAGLGYRVTVFSKSLEAVEFFRADPEGCDLALLDYNIPELNGVEICRLLKNERPGLPVIMYTGMNKENLRREADQEGVRQILSKPLNRAELAVAVRSVLDAIR